MYALIRVLLEYIRQAQKEKHTAEEILENLRDMLPKHSADSRV